MAIINGRISMNGRSTATVKGVRNVFGRVSMNGTSRILLARLQQIVFLGKSTFTVTPVVLKRGRVSMNGKSSFSARLMKAGKEFFRISKLQAQAIYFSTLEGGGGDYMKENQDFELSAGDYKEIHFTVLDEKENPKDISGCSFEWIMDDVIKTVGNGITITNPTAGEIVLILTAEDTAEIRGKRAHKMRMVDAYNHGTTILKGVATVNK